MNKETFLSKVRVLARNYGEDRTYCVAPYYYWQGSAWSIIVYTHDVGDNCAHMRIRMPWDGVAKYVRVDYDTACRIVTNIVK